MPTTTAIAGMCHIGQREAVGSPPASPPLRERVIPHLKCLDVDLKLSRYV